MNRKGVVVILVLMFGLALGAGAVAGKLFARLPKDPTAVPRRATLAEELKLTPEQNLKMQAIWEEVSKKSNTWIKDAKMIQVDEDKELMDHILTTDEQKKAFQDLRNESARKLNLLEAERKAAFDKAVKDSTDFLNEDQRRLYRQIINDKTGALPASSGGGASDGWNFANTARACR